MTEFCQNYRVVRSNQIELNDENIKWFEEMFCWILNSLIKKSQVREIRSLNVLEYKAIRGRLKPSPIYFDLETVEKGSEKMKVRLVILGILIVLSTSGAGAKEFRFPEITGWSQSGEIQTFTPKTLFEYIDGAADLYIVYDFQELKVAEYKDEKKASVTVEVYEPKTPTHAFGIYSQERLPNANFVEVGAQGYIENNVLNFLIGPYYVKMTSYNTGAEDREILLTFARKMSENLGWKGTLPSILFSFPEEGKKQNSEKYINRNFLGYSFFHSAFIADYELSGKKFKLFIIEGADRKDCGEMIEKYLQQNGSAGRNVVEGIYTISDPYHGEIEFHWKGKFIWSALNLNDASLRSKYLKLLEAGLQKEK